MQDTVIELLVDYLRSNMSFEEFVNHLEWNNSVAASSSEITLINLCSANRACAHYARLVLRRRIVIFNGTDGLRQFFARIDEKIPSDKGGESTTTHPWVNEICIRVARTGELDHVKPMTKLLMRILRLCPNVEELLIDTMFTDNDHKPFDRVTHMLGDLCHLKSLWLKHTTAGPPFAKPNLSKLLVILPKLHKLTSLFVDGWVPFHFRSPDSKRPRSLKKITILRVAFFPMDECDPEALLWLLNPDITNSSGPTALALDLKDALSYFPYDEGPVTLLECSREALEMIESLRLYRCHANSQFKFTMVLKHCKALESLSVILRYWQPRMNEKYGAPPGVSAGDIDPNLLPLPPLPDSVRRLYIHLEYAKGERVLEDEHERDRLLVAQMKRCPQLKQFTFTRPPLRDEKGVIIPSVQTLDLTREHCSSVGIEFSQSESTSPTPF